jgi:hypothetical protein
MKASKSERRERVVHLRDLRSRLQSRLGLANRFRDELIMQQVAKVDAEIARVEGGTRRPLLG